MRGRFNDITGKTFGRLTAHWPAGRSRTEPYWLYTCACGVLRVVRSSALTSGTTVSCQCYRRTKDITHGHCGTRTYKSYHSAKHRCESQPGTHWWKYYGARGIQFKFESFEQFLAELGPRPIGKTLDRIDNNGNYEPGNCRWATWSEQVKNRRKDLLLHRRRQP